MVAQIISPVMCCCNTQFVVVQMTSLLTLCCNMQAIASGADGTTGDGDVRLTELN